MKKNRSHSIIKVEEEETRKIIHKNYSIISQQPTRKDILQKTAAAAAAAATTTTSDSSSPSSRQWSSSPSSSFMSVLFGNNGPVIRLLFVSWFFATAPRLCLSHKQQQQQNNDEPLLLSRTQAEPAPRAINIRSNQQQTAEMLPEGITDNRPKVSEGDFSSFGSYPVSSDAFRIEPGQPHVSTFDVEPNHVQLRSRKGVLFNVETVPEPLVKHLRKPVLDRSEMIDQLQQDLVQHYNGIYDDYYWEQKRSTTNNNKKKNKKKPSQQPFKISTKDIQLEALTSSETSTSNNKDDETNNKNQKVVYMGGNGFIMALMTAFAQHLPLMLSPDHIWTLITYAFAQHVKKHAEDLRSKFVAHAAGKKRLVVRTPNDFKLNPQPNHPNTTIDTTTIQAWETYVFPQFSQQIKDSLVGSGDSSDSGSDNSLHNVIASNFSTTTPTAKACHEIALMSSMKQYFSFGMETLCGIPQITLLGTEQDWKNLRTRAEQLGNFMTSEFQQYWMPLLLPVLDEFVKSYQNKDDDAVNYGFWQSMVKLRDTGGGSGSYSFVSGWSQIFFPYLATGDLNQNLRPWHKMYFAGPKLEQFPSVQSSAPVDWNYFGTTMEMTFKAGILGFTQIQTTNDNTEKNENENLGALSPMLGWYVLHNPPQPSSLQLQEYEQERDDLIKGHENEDPDPQQRWYQRVQYLNQQIELLLQKQQQDQGEE